MGERIKKLKKIRIHREGTDELLYSLFAIIAIGVILWRTFDTPWPFILFIALFGTAWLLMLNFYRCPIRYFNGDTDKIVVAPADGRVVVIEEAEENTYFHDRRLMISIFMSPLNVHANWFPVDGRVKFVHHQAGAMARRIVTYAKDQEDCYIDEHLGFIKLGSRVDVYLPLGSKPEVKMGQPTTGDQTVIARLA